jgi:hypothetical protein
VFGSDGCVFFAKKIKKKENTVQKHFVTLPSWVVGGLFHVFFPTPVKIEHKDIDFSSP